MNTRKSGVELIADERKRQIEQEGYTSEHDDDIGHSNGVISVAAICYATIASSGPRIRGQIRERAQYGYKPTYWPWDLSTWKPGPDDTNESRIRELVKAGALLAAEIDRLQRQSVRQSH